MPQGPRQGGSNINQTRSRAERRRKYLCFLGGGGRSGWSSKQPYLASNFAQEVK